MEVEEPHSRMIPPAGGEVAGNFRVMVIDQHFQAGPPDDFGKPADPGGMLAVDDDEAGNKGKVQVPGTGEGEAVAAGPEEEVAQGLLLGTGKDHERLGIELPGGDHGPEAVKIGVDVGSYHIHGEIVPQSPGRWKE